MDRWLSVQLCPKLNVGFFSVITVGTFFKLCTIITTLDLYAHVSLLMTSEIYLGHRSSKQVKWHVSVSQELLISPRSNVVCWQLIRKALHPYWFYSSILHSGGDNCRIIKLVQKPSRWPLRVRYCSDISQTLYDYNYLGPLRIRTTFDDF